MRNRQATLAVLIAVVPLATLAGDGAIEINQARALAGGVTAGDAAGFPVTLSAPGRYVLSSDLTVPSQNTTAVEIAVEPVVLDLNGFALRGPVTCPGSIPICTTFGTGIGVSSNQNGVTVRDGAIIGMGSFGVSLGSTARLENLRVGQNALGGASVASASLVSGCTITNNGAFGLSVGYGSRVADNVIFRNVNVGITFTGGTSGYGGNTIRENAGLDTNPQVSLNGLQLSPNQCGADLTCP